MRDLIRCELRRRGVLPTPQHQHQAADAYANATEINAAA
jgi:hypothetical protein